MGPCTFAKPENLGVCGANRDVVVARNILRMVAAGAASHSGHAFHLLEYLGEDYPEHYIEQKSPPFLFDLWDSLGIVPKIHFEHFKDISEALHTSTMGMNASYQDLLKWCMKIGIVEGYYGLYLSTELEDKAFGKPQPREGMLDLGVIEKDKINIAIHGHEPMLAEALTQEASKPENSDINLVGVCCSGASLLSRHGIPLAANVILQEDVIATGLIEAMAVDVQCIFPTLIDLAECFHTTVITTHEDAMMPHATHLPLNKESSSTVASKIIEIARENRIKRHEDRWMKLLKNS
jgi:carbon-monoxide dehydrogenase catalytic subunit